MGSTIRSRARNCAKAAGLPAEAHSQTTNSARARYRSNPEHAEERSEKLELCGMAPFPYPAQDGLALLEPNSPAADVRCQPEPPSPGKASLVIAKNEILADKKSIRGLAVRGQKKREQMCRRVDPPAEGPRPAPPGERPGPTRLQASSPWAGRRFAK